jgi:hypothetical protein
MCGPRGGPPARQVVTQRKPCTAPSTHGRINERLKALGIADYPVPQNPGTRRTPEKRALLQQIADNARAQGREPQFKAKF